MKKDFSRREFIKRNSIAGAGVLAMGATPSLFAGHIQDIKIPAILGGQAVRSEGWPGWPVWNAGTDEKRILEVLRSGNWSRSRTVSEFEEKWANTIGAKRCLTTVNGTNALICAIANLDIGGGDEVIVSPYTWISTVQAILQNGAMPVFADIDPETFQIDPVKIEQKITSRTRAILPVHILGLPADMVRIMEIANKHDLVVVEDACQAWMAEINHKKVGTFGNAGCFSFQNSKNIPMGEGGAIVSDDEGFMDSCYSYHRMGTEYGSVTDDSDSGRWIRTGTKMQLTEYQAAIGLAQLERLEEQTRTRSDNAEYLKSQIKDIPGITPYKLYDNVTRAAFHLFPFRYHKEQFDGLSRSGFLRAMRAEGVSGSGGYTLLHTQPFIRHAFNSKNFQLMYPKHLLDIDQYLERNQCPETERICNEEAVWFSQSMLLGNRADMDDIAGAIGKIQKNAGKIKDHLS